MGSFSPNATSAVDLILLAQCLFLSLLYGFVLSQVFKKCSRVVTDRGQFVGVFFVLIPLMILVISVVKSSLALSLGLVGALSIVRFRTPIKEPEELIYIFLAIGVGLGLGAGQILVTTICFVFITGIIVIESFFRKKNHFRGLFVDIEGTFQDGMNVEKLSRELKEKFNSIELRRYVSTPESKSITYSLDIDTSSKLNEFLTSVEAKIKTTNVTVIDRSRQLD